jgi:DNA-directed RNA polymerase subunit M/transcription elongation factor TFIIS
MYAVVGCNECGNLWLLSDPGESETATCSRCGKTHRTKRLRRFAESEDREAARQARAAMLAKKHGDSEAFAETAHVSEMEALVDEGVIDDDEYLAESGLDADAVEDAGERAETGRAGGSSQSRLDVVRAAVRESDDPTEDAVAAYAEERGVPGAKAREILERLTRRGDVSESRGRYRLL